MPTSDSRRPAASGPGSRADQVRSAVDSAFQTAGAQLGRERAVDLADELTSAAQRVREALEDLRPSSAEDVKRLDERLDAIEGRLSALERAARPKPARRAAPKPKPKPKPAARKSARKPAGGSGG